MEFYNIKKMIQKIIQKIRLLTICQMLNMVNKLVCKQLLSQHFDIEKREWWAVATDPYQHCVVQ